MTRPAPQAPPRPQCFCPHQKTPHPAAFCIAWRSDGMTAPAFDYLCPRGFATHPKTDRVSEDVRIIDSAEGFTVEDLCEALNAAREGTDSDTKGSAGHSFNFLVAECYFRALETSKQPPYHLCVLLIDVRNVAAQLKGK
jgi:hypothetical protein